MHDAVDCDNDPASAGWTNWELAQQQTATIKIEPPVFQTLRPAPSGIINVDSPPPAKRARASLQMPNPDHLPGLEDCEEDDGFPRVGAPREPSGGAGYKDACLLVSLQNLGLPVV